MVVAFCCDRHPICFTSDIFRMDAPTFDAHSSVCPVCQQSLSLQSAPLFTGLLTCKRCQQRLVVSWSGHYVRDPFRMRYAHIERSLRRESHPFYRILRDLRLARPSLWLAILLSMLLLGVLGATSEQLSFNLMKSFQVETPERDR